jgi:hypothetical protein
MEDEAAAARRAADARVEAAVRAAPAALLHLATVDACDLPRAAILTSPPFVNRLQPLRAVRVAGRGDDGAHRALAVRRA